jgi:hypothetical protein
MSSGQGTKVYIFQIYIHIYVDRKRMKKLKGRHIMMPKIPDSVVKATDIAHDQKVKVPSA